MKKIRREETFDNKISETIERERAHATHTNNNNRISKRKRWTKKDKNKLQKFEWKKARDEIEEKNLCECETEVTLQNGKFVIRLIVDCVSALFNVKVHLEMFRHCKFFRPNGCDYWTHSIQFGNGFIDVDVDVSSFTVLLLKWNGLQQFCLRGLTQVRTENKLDKPHTHLRANAPVLEKRSAIQWQCLFFFAISKHMEKWKCINWSRAWVSWIKADICNHLWCQGETHTHANACVHSIYALIEWILLSCCHSIRSFTHSHIVMSAAFNSVNIWRLLPWGHIHTQMSTK